MKSYRFLFAVLTLAVLASCSPKATVEGVLEGAGERELVVRLLDVNSYKI